MLTFPAFTSIFKKISYEIAFSGIIVWYEDKHFQHLRSTVLHCASLLLYLTTPFHLCPTHAFVLFLRKQDAMP